MGHITQSTIVSRWFQKKRGFALGLMSTGVGIGGFTLAPIIGVALIPNLGWRMSYLALAIITWITIIPLALFVIKAKPSDMGLNPDGVTHAGVTIPSKLTVPQTPLGLTFKETLATSTFWLIALSFLTSAFSQATILQSEVVYFTDSGIPLAFASTLHGFVGLGSAVGKFIFGWLCDHIDPKYAAVIGHVLIIVAVLLLLNMKSDSSAIVLWLYVGIFGLGMGSWLPTMAMLVNLNFGLVAYGVIIGMISLAQSLGSSTGPLVSNIVHDATGTYRIAFIVSMALYAIAIPAMLLARRPKHSSVHTRV
jgi:MFS family permease